MTRHVRYTEVRSAPGFARGAHAGTVVDGVGRLRIANGDLHGDTHAQPHGDPHLARPGDPQRESARWTSDVVECGFPAEEAVLSWEAATPTGTWVELDFRARHADGSWTEWFTMARWAAGDDVAGGDIRRATVSGQHDVDGAVRADTFVAAEGRAFDAYRLRVTLVRRAGSGGDVTLGMVGAMVSAIDDGVWQQAQPQPQPQPGSGGAERGIRLDVPTLSQQVHVGERADLGGGGEAWCSPTSTAMVLAFWERLPPAAALATVPAPNGDPEVVWAAAGCYDHDYGGTGNWSFNAAFAARQGLDSFVTRLRSLAEAERFMAAGIPLIASVSFTREELPEAGYVTEGHLLVIAGFDGSGDVVVNDPGAPDASEVRRTYPREPFERAWLQGSGGVVYVMRPETVPLPAPVGEERNW